MSPLYGPNGQLISSSSYKKADPPKSGPAFGQWGGDRNVVFSSLPGGGLVQMDLSKLTLEDYRNMRDHYQVNASLSVLTFMLHQSDWHIECDDKKIADHCEANLREIWTPLCRSLGTAHWAGYSPNALQWDNDLNSKTLQLTKVKDMYPEECMVNWKQVEGWAPPGHVKPKFREYDGIKQFAASRILPSSQSWPIPSENSLWFPLLMENGDHYGRKLLRPAFQSWFFSLLVHLFANRYYERYGEPTPIGRASFEDELAIGDGKMRGNDFMLSVLQQLRNRSVVVLPNDKTDMGHGKLSFDYEIEYLESQMRGADFERYLTRLDEEVSIGIFTPILLMRTADVGSYNLGVGHMQIWLWMLNALNADRKLYIDKYLLARMADFNFSEKAPRPKIVFRKLGNSDTETVRAVLVELIRGGKAMPDLDELGVMAGLDIKKVRELTAPTGAPGDPNADPNAPQTDPRVSRTNPAKDKGTGPKGVGQPRSTAKDVAARIRPQVENAFRDGRFGTGLILSMGYRRRMEEEFRVAGVQYPERDTHYLYDRMDVWSRTVLDTYASDFPTPESFLTLYEQKLDAEIERVFNG
jgi:hypothetical protein